MVSPPSRAEGMPLTISIPTPAQCHLWLKEDLSPADLDGTTFERLHTYDDDSHLNRRLLRCTDCGQLYFYEFYEEIDHDNSEDPQYRTYIPVTDEADAAKLAKMWPFELLTFTPRLQRDFPREAKHPSVCWIGK
jgi:hypothetical protein